jgi:ABC-type phosphate transport system substrate-binding protein
MKTLCLALLLLMFCLPSEAKHMAVIVNKDNSVANLTAGDLAKIFQVSTRKWADGKNITIILRDLTSADTQEALQRLYKLSEAQTKAFMESHRAWFVVADTDEAVIKIVENTPGAVGLVDVYSITANIHVLKVDGKLPLEQGYLLH